ncbi:hypothetical protein L1049_002161 [Liquidambar formosana]|uniref:Uncharacterized protein n=1 Tax=Liquidambar formosana TaxID=63359 RepID=A0AAP0R6F9_LIQFO
MKYSQFIMIRDYHEAETASCFSSATDFAICSTETRINFDGARDRQGQRGAGRILVTVHVNRYYLSAQYFKESFIREAENSGFLDGLIQEIESNNQNVQIEGDLQILINALIAQRFSSIDNVHNG